MLIDPPIPEALPIPQLEPHPPMDEPTAGIPVGGGVNPVKIEVMVGLGAFASGGLTVGTAVAWEVGVPVLTMVPGCKVAVGVSIPI
jgi:hypothetical protein